MQAEKFPLNSETLRRFVPFDELTLDARSKLVAQAEIVPIGEGEQLSETLLDACYTLYLLDGELALLAGERLVDTLQGGSPISRFPLSRLRSGQLTARASTDVRLLRIARNLVSQLLNAGAHSENSSHSPDQTSHEDSRSPSGILAAMEAVPAASSAKSGEHHQLSLELAQAEAEIESALHDKAEATIARRLWASSFQGLEASPNTVDSASLESQMALLLSRQAQLEQRSRNASDALTKAQRRKLELEAALHTMEAEHAQQLAHAQAIDEQLRRDAQAELLKEAQQIEARYQQVLMKLTQLEESKQAAEGQLETQRKEIEDRFAKASSQLQKEAGELRAALRTVREAPGEGVDVTRTAQTLARERLRTEVETRLKEARTRLQAELEQSERTLESAQRELDAAQRSRQAAVQEAQQLSAQLQNRKVDARDPLQAVALPREAVAAEPEVPPTRATTAPPQHALTPPPGSLELAPRAESESAALDFSKHAAASGTEDQLLADLESIEHRLAHADSRILKAANAKEKAARVKCHMEEQVARHLAVEDELRLEVCEETEERLRAQWQCSEEQSRASIALVEAMAGRAAGIASEPPIDANEVMMGDIHQQLERHAPATGVNQTMQSKAETEQRVELARSEQERAKAERLKAKHELQRARAHLIELRSKMRNTHSSNSD